jgi:hypothetical protein
MRPNQDALAFRNFAEFYAYYLTEHRKLGTRIVHFVATLTSFMGVGIAMVTGRPVFLLAVNLAYLANWVSHFWIERNRPTTFRWFVASLGADLCMFGQLAIGKLPWSERPPAKLAA